MTADTQLGFKPTESSIKSIARKVLPTILWGALRDARLNVESIGGFPREVITRLGSSSVVFGVDGPIEQRRAKTLGGEKVYLTDILGVVNRQTWVVNIGAHIGTASLFIAKNVPDGMVTAIEPDPACANKLRYNAELNGLRNIQTIQCAVSNINGYATLNTSGLEGPAASLGMHSNGVVHSSSINVPRYTLDTLFRTNRSPDVLVVDVEGHELAVFEGMTKLQPSHIFVEVHPKMGISLDMIRQILGSKGYLCVRKYNRGTEILTMFVNNAK